MFDDRNQDVNNTTLTGKGSILQTGSATGKSVGPLGLNSNNIISAKPGVVGLNDSSNPDNSKKQELDNLLKRYKKIVKEGRDKGKYVAADMLEHWLNGSGTEKNLDYKWLRSFSSVIDAEKTNKDRFEEKTIAGIVLNMQLGQILYEEGYWDRKLTARTWKELYYASGTSVITSRGKFKLVRKDAQITITGTVEHHWWDPYDWHAGLIAYIPGFGDIKDSDAIKLERAGYGKPFGMYSIWHQSFSGIYGIDTGFAYFDQTTYSWGEVKEGSAPSGSTGNWGATHDAMTDAYRNPLPGTK